MAFDESLVDVPPNLPVTQGAYLLYLGPFPGGIPDTLPGWFTTIGTWIMNSRNMQNPAFRGDGNRLAISWWQG